MNAKYLVGTVQHLAMRLVLVLLGFHHALLLRHARVTARHRLMISYESTTEKACHDQWGYETWARVSEW